MTTVLVFGGRKFSNYNLLEQTLDECHRAYTFTRLVHGGAPGADVMAHRWAKDRDIPVKVYYARWEVLGKKAGPTRNQLMLDSEKIDLAIGFPGSFGTADMIKRIETAKIEFIKVLDQS